MTNLLSCFFLVLILILKTPIPELFYTGDNQTRASKAQNQQQTPLPSLHRLAAPYFELGTTYKNNFENPEAAEAIIQDHFALITPENAFKPNVILRADQNYNWKRSDAVIEFAKKNKAKVRGHTLVWHKQTSNAFFKDANGKDLSKNALYKRLEGYMTKVMQRYGDQVYAWDVVNEAISDYNSSSIYRTKNSNWYRICGPDFIEQAFRIAHKVDPNAKLFYNDYNLISPKKLEKTYLMLKLLMAKGVPIHGIGLQAHWNIDTQPSAVEEAIERFASLGLEVHITELDISIVKQKDNKKQKTIAFTQELEQKQAQLYVKLFQTFKKYEAITNVTFWGGSDIDSWLNDHPVENRRNYPLLFDDNYAPKKSFFAIANELKGEVINEKKESERPNFVFYLADDQDQFDYKAYGNPKAPTPTVDYLASEGIKFTNAYTAQAICAPSRSQIFTGKYPVKNGCMANHIAVKRENKSIAHYLKAEGYEVILAGKSHVKPNAVFNWTHYFPEVDKILPMEKIKDYIRNAKKPFCLFIASDFPHGPYPKQTRFTREDIQRPPYSDRFRHFNPEGYYQNIDNDDKQLKTILNFVDQQKLADKTVFVYASDHGIRGKFGVSEVGLKIPVVVRWPKKIQPKTQSTVKISLVDILPTFLDIAGAPIPSDIDGKSFYPALLGDESPTHKYLFGVSTRQNIQRCFIFPARSVRGERYKLIRNYNSLEKVAENLGDNPTINAFIKKGANAFPKKPYEELYDLEKDPYERNNLSKNPDYNEIKTALGVVLENWMRAQNDFIGDGKMPLIKPTLHPLDRNSKWNKVSDDLTAKLKPEDYLSVHY